MLKYSLSILSLFCLVLGFSQNKVELTINPSSAEIGEVFSITITSNVSGTLVFDKVPDEFNQDYNISQGSQQEIDYNSGQITNIYYFTITGLITKAGTYEFGPAYISKGSKSYPSNVATIKISPRIKMNSGSVTAQQLSDPAFGLIQTNKSVIYEGEPLLISAKIYAKYNPTHVGTYKSYGVPGTTLKYPIGNTTSFKKSIESFKGDDYYSFSYDKNVIFPAGVGQYQIDPFRMNLHQGYQNFPIISNGSSITIKPLPSNPPSDFIGAVGDFRIEREIKESKIKQGDVIKMIVTVSGIGNLQNITEPELNLPKGFAVYGDPIITENYSIGVHGAEGEIAYEFNIEVRKSGQQMMPATSISYFDPLKEEYVQVSTDSNTLNIKAVQNYVANSTDLNVEDRSTELIVHRSALRESISNARDHSLYGSTLFWSGISLPVLAAFLFILFTKRKEKSEEQAEQKKVISERITAFKERISIARAHISQGTESEFYSQVDAALRKGFEIELDFHEDRILNKSDIIEYVGKTYSLELQNRVKVLFTICEQSKYGFVATSMSRQEIMNELDSIITELNHIK